MKSKPNLLDRLPESRTVSVQFIYEDDARDPVRGSLGPDFLCLGFDTGDAIEDADSAI